MAEPLPKQYIQVGEHQVALPPGVSVDAWSLEKVRCQNPRIRAYLGSIRLLEQTNESNYAILHCSPGRLLQIWRRVRRVCQIIQTRLAPTLSEPSLIPALDTARRNAELSYFALSNTVITRLEQYPYRIADKDLITVRRLLCRSIGKIYEFLRDTFGEIVASDPRSLHDSDYYLSKRFPQDIEEAEWLYASVDKLNDYMQEIGRVLMRDLQEVAGQIRSEPQLPTQTSWRRVDHFLTEVIEGLAPKLKEVLALTGIRYDEMEPLDEYAFKVPHNCYLLRETYELGRRSIEELKTRPATGFDERAGRVEDLLASHRVIGSFLLDVMTRIEQSIQDLLAYVPIWLNAIEKRRALMLTKNPDEIPQRSTRTSRRSGPE
ncbi:MAG: hypothetical protein ACE5GX_13970 [Thermoanaerobaculia bacterium]